MTNIRNLLLLTVKNAIKKANFLKQKVQCFDYAKLFINSSADFS